ncbi:MAG: ABC transporter ATP-binding protein [Chloroflexi bacterium]|nr:MAG: ABC transporter ATP-binding protein [Chloroflexota bacterium]
MTLILIWSATNALRADLALHCLRLDMAFYNSHTPGELIERVDGDMSGLPIQMIASALLVVGVILLLLREDWAYSKNKIPRIDGKLLSRKGRAMELSQAIKDTLNETQASLSGYKRRHFMAQVVKSMFYGKPSWAENVLSWNRKTLSAL